ncbi:MAG TPA: hypothetical protein VMF60_05725, partial [Acidimicrobiales bacterium]|nr:hypothetical protein [Acidimicrobiales bacterium]
MGDGNARRRRRQATTRAHRLALLGATTVLAGAIALLPDGALAASGRDVATPARALALATATATAPPATAPAPSAPATHAPAPATAGSARRPGGKKPSTATPGAAIPGAVDLDAGLPGVAPPPDIADDCTVDVSGPLQSWLHSLSPGTLVRPPAGACYRVDRGITLRFPHDLTIDGGTFSNTTTVRAFTGSGRGRATFTVLGGSDVTFDDLTIRGADPGGYHPALAFEAGIEFEGTDGARVRNVAIDDVYGDGISLEPLRGGSDHMSGTIVAPTRDLTLDTVAVDGSGRQGIALVSVNTADIDDVMLAHVGIDSFDVEADQANEGAKNVTIDGCTSDTWNGGSFFADGGASSGSHTGNITVENCRMLHPQGGDAVLVDNAAGAPDPRGPFTFTGDTLWCGASVYVSCVSLDGATVSVTGSTVSFPR